MYVIKPESHEIKMETAYRLNIIEHVWSNEECTTKYLMIQVT